LPLSQIPGFALACPHLSFDRLDIFILSDVERKKLCALQSIYY
jgi:hypothetical protein